MTAAHQPWHDSRWFALWLALARGVALLCACVSLRGATVPNLTLDFSASGRVTNVVLNGSALTTAGDGGFEIADFAVSTNAFTAISGALSGTSLTATTNNVRLTATITTNATAILITGSLTNLAASDRAIALRFRVPVNAATWTWHDDTVTTRSISGSTEFKNVTSTEAGAGEQSIYPLAAISIGTNGLAIATPITFSPRVYTFKYDAGSTGLLATVYLSLSTNATRNLNASSFSFMLHPANGANAFRSALAKQHALYPAAFTPRQSFQAAYRWGMGEYITTTNSLYIGPSNIYTNGSDFGASYDYIAPVHGCYYSAFWPDPLGTNTLTPSDAAVKAWLSTYPADPYSSVIAGSNAVQQLEEDDAGNIRYVVRTYDAGWTFLFRVNEDPSITDALPQMLDAAITNYPAHAAFKPAITVDGAEGFVGMTQLDYATAHINTMSYPPTFGAASLKPAVVNQIWDFYDQYLWPRSASYSFTVIGNSGSPDLVHIAPYLDIFMSEGVRTIADFRSYRALAGKKIVRNWSTIAAGATYTDAQFATELNQCLSLGMYPVLAMLVYGDKFEAFRPLYKLYIPAITALSAAGWEPVNGASATAGAVVERFGTFAGGNLNFSVANTTTNTVTPTVTIDRTSLAIPSGTSLTARDLVTGSELTVSGSNFSVTLTNGQTKAFNVASTIKTRGFLRKR